MRSRDTSNAVEKLEKTKAWSTWEFLVYLFLCSIALTVVIVFGVWWFSPNHVADNFFGPWRIFDFVLFGLLTYVVWYQIINEVYTWWTGLFMRHPVPMEPVPGKKVALVTAFVPGVEPYEILEKAFIAMKAVEYPHDTWVLDEGNDETVKKLCTKYNVNHFSRKGIPAYNTEAGHFRAKTKAGNYNSWFDKHGAKYDFVAQHDVDFAPKPDYLLKTLGYFNDPEVGFVGSPQIYGNVNESWIAKAAAEQAYGFYGSIQKGLFGQDMQLFIGANHVIRMKAHDSIGGYSGHIVEDHLTGMRLYAVGWKSVYVPEILLVGEGPATWEAYFSQQTRWAYGLIDILFRHTPGLIPKMKLRHAVNYILLQQYYFFGVVQVLGLFLIALFFVFGIQATAMDTTILLILYPLFLIMQTVITLWMQRSYIDYKTESGFYILGKFLNIIVWPIYVLALISALVGRKLTYQVTPKGSAQSNTIPHLGIFVTQIVIGTVAALSVLAALVNGRTLPLLMFWALVIMSFMYFVVFYVSWEKIVLSVQTLTKKHNISIYNLYSKLAGTILIAVFFAGFSWQIFSSYLNVEETEQVTQAYRTILTNERTVDIKTETTDTEKQTDDQIQTETITVSHTVQPGDSLRKLASRYFNDETLWKKIDYQGDPDLIFPGEVLTIETESSS